MDRLSIPPVDDEAHEWRVQAPELYSERENQRQTGTYHSAILPFISDWEASLSNELLTDAENASLAVRSYDDAVAHRGVVAPMAAILLRTESTSSSQIEQITASAKQLALAELAERGDLGDQGRARSINAQTVVGNVRAMEAAVRLAGNLTIPNILEMHRALLSQQAGMEDEAGRLRQQLVWIGGSDSAGPRATEFVPPQHHAVPAALDDLVRFMARRDIPTMVHLAVAHAQFETIHPFVDGNGRTGRALVQAMAQARGLIRHAALPLSAGVLTDVTRYFDALAAFRAGDAAPMVRVFTTAARFAASTGTDLVMQLEAELATSRELLGALRPQSNAWRLLPLLLSQPVVSAAYVKSELSLNDAAAQRALAALVEHGVLRERTGNYRNRSWEHPGILKILDDYARMITRQALRRP
ncbi:MAG: Fic family protein [Micrococcaceae bacterium]